MSHKMKLRVVSSQLEDETLLTINDLQQKGYVHGGGISQQFAKVVMDT